MNFHYKNYNKKVHRLIPSRYPPVLLFDWAETEEELEQIAALEGLTNDRLKAEYGDLSLVMQEDWIGGPGTTPLISAFTHPGWSRFSNGSYGVYYAGDSLETAIKETKFHRERFLKSSQEQPCLIQMREYIAQIVKPLVDLTEGDYEHVLSPDINSYSLCQAFALDIKQQKEYGLFYPSVRSKGANCIAVFRPPALTIPVQGCHLDYIWDGSTISEVRKSLLVHV